MRILGVDPGIAQTGWGVVEASGQRYRSVSFGVITTAAHEGISTRIHAIANEIGELAVKHAVAIVSIEDVYFAKNVSSALVVAKVIGAIIQQVSCQNLPVRLYTPLQIKQAVTGSGAADKHQVQEMVRVLLQLTHVPKSDHAADSLAAAICLASTITTEMQLHRQEGMR